MKKLFLLFVALFIFMPKAQAEIPLPEAVNAAKYTVIKTTGNYTPIRDAANENAKRFSHLKKGVTIFSDDAVENFYRVDLGLDRAYWIEKKYATPEFETNIKVAKPIDNITFQDNEKYFTAKIKTDTIPPYNEYETSNKTMDFILYDTVLDENLVAEGKTSADFSISKDKFNNLKISYTSEYPLTGHDVEKAADGLVLKVKKPFEINKIKPLSKLTFVIDPGHGGIDPGACRFNLKEKDLNLQISKILAEELEKAGAKAYLTREDDTNPGLYERVDFAKEKGADFLISIHQNSLPQGANADIKRGVGVYYYNKESVDVAHSIQNSIIKETGFKDDGVNFTSLVSTRPTDPICILIECGYMTNKEEIQKLANEKFQKTLSKAIINGVKNYLVKNF